jgi:SAM-dependent methyltransferase
MTTSEVWDEETAASYDEDSAEMFEPEVLGPAVAFLAEIAGPGPALEFAIGTGRVGVPLMRTGVSVTGVELSEPMVARLRDKVTADELPVSVGTMATTRVEGEFSLVFLVWNSLMNLRTQAEQLECFRNAARHLAPGGRFVIELQVPAVHCIGAHGSPNQAVVPVSANQDHLIFDAYDLVSQELTSHHYSREPDGAVRHNTGHFRYVWPAELDLMAQLAGLELEERYADWHRRPFTSTSESHVSIWRLAASRPIV